MADLMELMVLRPLMEIWQTHTRLQIQPLAMGRQQSSLKSQKYVEKAVAAPAKESAARLIF